MENAATKPLLLSRRDAAVLLSISIRSLDNLIARRRLPVRKVGKRVLVPLAALESFAKSDHETGQSKQPGTEVRAGA